MSGETARIAEIAERLSTEIFSFLRWQILPVGLMNQNFKCVNQKIHRISKEKQITNLKAQFEQEIKNAEKEEQSQEQILELKKLHADKLKKLKDSKIQDEEDESEDAVEEEDESEEEKLSKQHPVDAVFYYQDPYENDLVYFNCDLKSYQDSSITSTSLRNTINSLANSVHCASQSEEWNNRYGRDFRGEVRGLLFLLNHDAKYNKNISNLFYDQKNPVEEQTVHIENLQLMPNQFIHIIDPDTVRYLATIKKDVSTLMMDNKFPITPEDWYFFYPDLKRHRSSMAEDAPATIEMLLGPFLMIKHKKFKPLHKPETSKEGFLIYYKCKGESKEEFMYFLDTLSSYQIFKENQNIQVRLINKSHDEKAEENFNNAINEYIECWNLNSSSIAILKDIQFKIIENLEERFLTKAILYRDL